jgi:SHS2 domain-containing protein
MSSDGMVQCRHYCGFWYKVTGLQVNWEEIDHTADWSIRVWGATLEGLFLNAARAMITLIGGEAPDAPDIERYTISLPPNGDHETLLINWLNEILFLIEDLALLCQQVSITSLDEGGLTGLVEGCPGGSFGKHIKAATFQAVAIKRTERGLETTIVFDV